MEVRDDVSFFVEFVYAIYDLCWVVVMVCALWRYVDHPHAVCCIAGALQGQSWVGVMRDVYLRSCELHIVIVVTELTQ